MLGGSVRSVRPDVISSPFWYVTFIAGMFTASEICMSVGDLAGWSGRSGIGMRLATLEYEEGMICDEFC
jgi:hypothetical protein